MSYLEKFMKRIGIADEHIAFMLASNDAVRTDEESEVLMKSAEASYMTGFSYDESLKIILPLEEKTGYRRNTLGMLMLMRCSEELRSRYAENGLDDDLFWDSMVDLRCKFNECVECTGVPGTFVGGWFAGFFRMVRFGIGRFQFELEPFASDNRFMYGSHIIEPHSDTVNLHVPSSGVPITDDIRLDSYRRAYKFYTTRFPDRFRNGMIAFTCESWLLYPAHKKFLPPHLNILRFADDFSVVWSAEHDGFPDCWRIFGRYNELPYDKLPQNTSLRKAYAEWLISGHKAGCAYGLFLFDGEKIVRD